MTTNARNALSRVGDVARVLGDAMATPRGSAPDRAVRQASLRREHL
jgi:hypothetical protein